MTTSTRDKLLAIGLEQFSQRGFDGVSIASIADTLGLSKQALLHHFSSKEKLYGEILARISGEFEGRVAVLTPGSDTPESIAALMVGLFEDSQEHPQQTSLLMRELLDNSQRAQRAGRWFLRDFLAGLIDRVHALPLWREHPRAMAEAAAYQLLGAVNYFAISTVTLRAIFGDEEYAAMHAAFPGQLKAMALATLSAGPIMDSHSD